MSLLNEDLMKTNLDLPDGEIKIEGEVGPVYADAINVHNKKKKETEKVLKDKKPELKKAFLGTKGETTVMPKTKELKKLKLSESAFKRVREEMNDAPEAYSGIFRVLDNMEHIIGYISELSDEELNYADMQQSYNILEDSLGEIEDYLFEIKEAERRNGTLKEDVAVMDRQSWGLQDKRNNKDIWSDIYNELVDMKDLETPHRKLKRTPKQRYSGAWDEGGVRVAPSRTDDAIVVKADEESQLDFAKEVADAYGVEFTVREFTSRYADAKFEMKIYPNRPVTNESLDNAKAFGRKAKSKDLKESVSGEIYGKVAKHFEYGAPSDTLETIADIVDRAVSNIEDGYDLEEAVGDALDSGLIYHKDLWAIKHYYEDSNLADETYESLYNDVYSITSDLAENNDVDECLNEKIEHKYIQPLKDKVYFCYSKEDLEEQGADLSQLSDKDIERILDGKVTNGDLEKMFGGITFTDDDFGIVDKRKAPHRKSNTQRRNDRMFKMFDSAKKNGVLKESYTEVDTIECGEDTYRVVGGGFNTNDALVSVEDKDGNKKRLSSGDVVEFYTWYDKNGNVIHEPSDDEE